MRGTAKIVLAFLVGACGSSGPSAEEQAKQQANQLEQKQQAAQPAQHLLPPVPNEAHVSCDQLINATAFQTALAEKDPLTVEDVTKTDAEAAASCSLLKGGAKLTKAQQDALSKKNGQRLGVLPGDAMCNVTAYCWTVENEDTFKARCKQKGKTDDESMGFYACSQVFHEGEDDITIYQFVDPDTKCILQVRGGPSMVDTKKVQTCAETARDSIGPDQIKVDAPAPTP